MGGEIFPKIDFNPLQLSTGEYVESICIKVVINVSSFQQINALDRFARNAPNALFLLLVAFFQVSSIICKQCCKPEPFLYI